MGQRSYVDTPITKNGQDSLNNGEELHEEEARRARRAIARISYLAQDRTDITVAARVLSQCMACLHRSRPFILGTLGRAQKVLRPGALSVLSTIVEYDSTNLLHSTLIRCVVFVSCTYVFAFKPVHRWTIPLVVLPLLLRIPCQVGFVNENPSGSWSEIRSTKPLWKSGSSRVVNLLTDRTLQMFLCSTAQTAVSASL